MPHYRREQGRHKAVLGDPVTAHHRCPRQTVPHGGAVASNPPEAPPTTLFRWALPPVLGHRVGLCRYRERSGGRGFVGDRGLVAAPGVSAAGVVADEAPEDLAAAGGLVGPAAEVLQD